MVKKIEEKKKSMIGKNQPESLINRQLIVGSVNTMKSPCNEQSPNSEKYIQVHAAKADAGNRVFVDSTPSNKKSVEDEFAI